MTRNYKGPRIDSDWASGRETHPAVATAIHAIADSNRSPDSIWEAPTPVEWDHVGMAVQEYIAHGDYEPTTDKHHNADAWG
jgi:hypothetical protein